MIMNVLIDLKTDAFVLSGNRRYEVMVSFNLKDLRVKLYTGP